MKDSYSIYRSLAQMMAMLPATANDIAARTGVTPENAQLWIRCLRAEGLVRYGEFRYRAGRLIVPGDGRTFDRSRLKAPHGLMVFAQAWRFLSQRRSSDDLAAHLGTVRRVAQKIILAMRQAGVARIGGWVMRNGRAVAMYDRLPSNDAPKPARVPRSEINAAYWARRADAMRASRVASA